ncbi:PQQ-binding-like beta-propeller repeat protein [Cellulosimicrobium sp. Marseille-Q4280]|uniref:outer membrane protein assembly factor BamB family protein n=1 Tax=Cellulosimicrobium sp. Marseille-Q4280 TaxID=2937992 RepID=UPI00203C75B4|nr:PQQ-binding-like beta-propeller repeat protein [Cellulosimicrobium sp. Marseille-Q4280]
MRPRRRGHDGAGHVRGRAGSPPDVAAADEHAPLRFELVADDDDPADDDLPEPRAPAVVPAPGGGSPGPRRRWYAHPVPWVAAVTALALGGSFLATRVIEAAQRVEVAALDGGLRPIEAPLEVSWSVPLDPGGAVIAGPGVVVTHGDGLTAYAVDDGTPVWRSEAVGELATCVPRADRSPTEVVVCLTPRDGPGVLLTVVQAASGRTLGERVVEVVGQAVVPVGDADVVRARWDEGDVVLVREEAATGVVRWERRVERERSGSMQLAVRSAGSGIVLDVDRGVVTLMAPGVVATFTEDGTVLKEGDVWTVVRLPDGRYVGNEYGSGTTTVFTAAGEPRVEVRGRAVEAPLSDGSVPGVLLMNTFRGVAGVDAVTGAPLWTLATTGSRPVVRVDGLVVLRTETTLHGVDVASGALRWESSLTDGATWPALTDGRSLLVAEGEGGRRQHLVSIALADGTVEWRWPIPERTYHAFTSEGRLFLLGTDRLSAVS